MANPRPPWETPKSTPKSNPPPPWETQSRAEVQGKKAEMKGAEEEKRVLEGEDALRLAIAYEVAQENPLLSEEGIRAETEIRLKKRVAELAPPLYTGGFDSISYAPLIPTAPPQELPGTPTVATALMPQTRVGTNVQAKFERESTAGLFDDAQFYDSISDLQGKERQDQVDAYEAYKAAYAKLRTINPKETGVTDEQLREDLNRQIAALSSGEIKNYVDDPANRLGYTGDPLARAFQRQVETGVVPMLEPGQLEFVQTLDRIQRGRTSSQAASDAETRLRTQGVEITRMEQRPTGDTGGGGKPIMETVQVPTGQFRPATEEEIKVQVEKERAKTAAENPLPFYMTPERDAILQNIEGSATGGIVFQKEYPTGATVESPSSWFLRGAMAIPNAMMGMASEAFTPDSVDSKEQAARPELYRDASASIYNISQSRGLMGEIGDLYDYNPDPDMKQYAWLGKAAGFAGDILSPDFALLSAASTGGRTLLAASKAAKVAGATERAVPALEAGLKAGSREFLSSIGLEALATKVPVGDIRLTYGAMLGDTYRAADVYERVYTRTLGASTEEAAKTAAHAEALREASKVAPRSRFVVDAGKAGPTIIEDLGGAGSYFGKGAKEWQEYRKVASATESLRDAANASSALASQSLRPYLNAAVREVPEVRAAIESLVTSGTKALKLQDVLAVVNRLPAEVAEKFYQTVKDSAALQAGFKAIDRGTKGLDPGRFVVKLTPRTFATQETADRILAQVKGTPEYKFLEGVFKGKALDNGAYKISDVPAFRKLVLTEATTGSLPKSVATRMLNAGDRVTPQDLRELLYSLEDGVAASSKETFRITDLAESKMRTIQGRGKVPVPGSRSISFGEDVGFVNSAIKRVTAYFAEAAEKPADLTRLLNAEQIRIAEDAKRSLGALPKRLEAALKTAKGDNFAQKIISLALRSPPGAKVGSLRNIAFWQDLAKSSIFGVSNRSPVDFLLGSFSYKNPWELVGPEGREALAELCRTYAVLTAQATDLASIERALPEFIEKAREITKLQAVSDFVRAEGKVFDLTTKPQDVLIGTWVRKEAGDIHTNALAKILDFEPDTLGDFSKTFREAFAGIKSPDGKDMGEVPLNVVVAQILREGSDSVRDIEDILALPAIKQWITDLDVLMGKAGQQARVEEAAQEVFAKGRSVEKAQRTLASAEREETRTLALIERAKKKVLTPLEEEAKQAAVAVDSALQDLRIARQISAREAVQANTKLTQAEAEAAQANTKLKESEDALTAALLEVKKPYAGMPSFADAASRAEALLQQAVLDARQALKTASAEEVVARQGAASAASGAGTTGETFIRANEKALFEDAKDTASAIGAFHGQDNGAQVAEDLEKLWKGEGTLGAVGGPLGGMLSEGLRQMLGEEPKFRQFMQELGALAEEGAKGKASAFYARRLMTNILDGYNNMFYTLVLYANPRFHGTNFVTAPFIGFANTGRVPSIASILGTGTIRDRYGVVYTAEQIYDALVKGGAVRTRRAADVDPKILALAQDMGRKAGIVGKITAIPAWLGDASDMVWRTAYVRDALKRGKTMEEALDAARASLYDYGAMTDVERTYLARNVLFYNFFRNNVLQTTKQMLVNPQRFARQVRLTQDVSKMVIGDEKWSEMRWYTPMDAGISRIVLTFAPQANREGKITLSPQMPYYDAVYLISGLLSTPLDLLRGSPDPVSGARRFGDSYIFEKLRPGTQNIIAGLASQSPLYDIRAKKNVAPVPHLAVMESFGLLPYYAHLFNMKTRPAEDGEEGFDGVVYAMSDEDFAHYNAFLKALKLAGADRPFADFGKIAATLDIFGTGTGLATGSTAATTFGTPEALGVLTTTKAGVPVEAVTKATKVKAEKLSEEAKKRSERSGLTRPEPKP